MKHRKMNWNKQDVLRLNVGWDLDVETYIRMGLDLDSRPILPIQQKRGGGELPETMKLAAMRLKGVQIENLPAIELIERYDTEDVFIYADPPYVHGTRKNYLYRYEMNDSMHEDLLKKLVRHPGKILLSGYDNDMYNDMLREWNKVQKPTRTEGGHTRTETLWMNYEIENGQISLTI